MYVNNVHIYILLLKKLNNAKLELGNPITSNQTFFQEYITLLKKESNYNRIKNHVLLSKHKDNSYFIEFISC